MGFEVSRDWRLRGVPVRTVASLSWTHDFEADSKSLGVHLQGGPGEEWMATSQERLPDALRAGMAIEVGLSERRALKIYGEQEVQQSRSVLHGGVTFTLGF